jgi:type I restriction enzyme R subunit
MPEQSTTIKKTAARTAKLDAAQLDLLCHLPFNAPLLTRRQRADRVKRQQTAFFNYFAPKAREIPSDLLERYAADGERLLTLPDVRKVPPISSRGNVNEITGRFGGAANLRSAVHQLQSLLYAT